MKTLVSDRIDVRISTEQKNLARYASELRGFKNLSEFVVFCINKESKDIITENNIILKSLEDKKVFVEALLHPAEPNEPLKQAQLKYQQFIHGISNTETK